MMSTRANVALPVIMTVLLSACSADETVYLGIIRSMPEDKVGTWHIGNRAIEVGRWTDIEEQEGEIMVGRCVEVDLDGDDVEEIVSRAMHRCIYPDDP